MYQAALAGYAPRSPARPSQTPFGTPSAVRPPTPLSPAASPAQTSFGTSSSPVRAATPASPVKSAARAISFDAPDTAVLDTLNAQALDKLIMEDIGKVTDRKESACARDWVIHGTTYINNVEFTQHGIFKTELAQNPRLEETAQIKIYGPAIIKNYCRTFNLIPAEITFIMLHATQTGALGKISEITGIFMEKWFDMGNHFPPALMNQRYNITKDHTGLKMTLSADYMLRESDASRSKTVDIFLSHISLTIETNSAAWAFLEDSYAIPQDIKINFTYSEPQPLPPFNLDLSFKLDLLKKYLEACQLLRKVWVPSVASHASIQML
jgi:hypothetical protein